MSTKRKSMIFSQQKKNKKKRRKHKRAKSAGLKRYHSYDDHKYFQRNPKKVERKLGPVDIGRIKYKGTKYKQSDYDFLAEKVHKHARSSSFTLRKKANPVQKNPTLSEIGTPFGWKKPAFYNSESEKMSESRLEFLNDTKPIHTRDKSLDRFKDCRLPKGSFAGQEMQPFSWKPIDYEVKMDKSHFLNEKHWYDASTLGLGVEDGFSHLLQNLPPEKLLLIQDLPPPTGYESKMNYLRKLKKIVFESDAYGHGLHNLQNMRLNRNGVGFLSVPLTSLNESSGSSAEESEISELSDFAESIEHDLDAQINDAINDILRSQSSSPSDMKIDVELIEEEEKKMDIHDRLDDEELDKQMTDALDEILRQKSCSPPMVEDEESMDQQMEDALNEILAPSPSPQPEVEVNVNVNTEILGKRKSRKELLEKVQMNLDDIQGKGKKDEVMIQNEDNKEKEDKKYGCNIPTNFLCPISKDIMNEAVMASDGRIYDRVNIENWLKQSDISPVSGQKLRHKMLMPFGELTDKINQWKLKNMVKKRRKRRKRKSSSSLKKKNVSSSETSDSATTDPECQNASNEQIKDVIPPLSQHEEQQNDTNSQ